MFEHHQKSGLCSAYFCRGFLLSQTLPRNGMMSIRTARMYPTGLLIPVDRRHSLPSVGHMPNLVFRSGGSPLCKPHSLRVEKKRWPKRNQGKEKGGWSHQAHRCTRHWSASCWYVSPMCRTPKLGPFITTMLCCLLICVFSIIRIWGCGPRPLYSNPSGQAWLPMAPVAFSHQTCQPNYA